MPLPRPPYNLVFLCSEVPARRLAPERALLGPRDTEPGPQRALYDRLRQGRLRGSEVDLAALAALLSEHFDIRISTEAFAGFVAEAEARRHAGHNRPREAEWALEEGLIGAGCSDYPLPPERSLEKMRHVACLSDSLWSAADQGAPQAFRDALGDSALAETATGQLVLDAVTPAADVWALRVLMIPLCCLGPLYLLAALSGYGVFDRAFMGRVRSLVPSDQKLERPMRLWIEQARRALGLRSQRAAGRCLWLNEGKAWQCKGDETDGFDALYKRRSGPDRAKTLTPDGRELRAAVARAAARCPDHAAEILPLGALHWALCLFENLARVSLCFEAGRARLAPTLHFPLDPALPFKDFLRLTNA